MTPKAKEFFEANKLSKVVEGQTIDIHGDIPRHICLAYGVRYTLKNGEMFELSSTDSQSLPDVPSWDF